MRGVKHLGFSILATVAIGLAGCGSTTSPAANAGAKGQAPLSKTEFIAEADAICKAFDSKLRPAVASLERLSESVSGDVEKLFEASETSADIRKVVVGTQRKIATLSEMTLLKIRALGPPPSDARTLEAMLEAAESSIELRREVAVSVENGEGDRALSIIEQDAGASESYRLGQRFGFEVCGTSVP